MINVPRRTAGATDERRDAQEGGGATERERERKRWPSNRKHLKKIPPPTIQNFVFLFDSLRDSGSKREEERTGNIVRGGEEKKSTFQFHGLSCRKGDGEVKKKKKSTRENAFRSKQT